MKDREWKGVLLLLLTAFIWGSAFVAQSVGMDYVGPFTFQSVRSLLATVALAVVLRLLRLRKERRGHYAPPTQEQKRLLLRSGVVCGVIMTVAANLQQAGIQYTTAGKAGFITTLYIVIVPMIGLFLHKKPDGRLWFCIALSLVGLYLLSMPDGFALSGGDTLVLLSAFAYAVHIVVVDRYASRVNGVALSALQFLVCTVLSGVLMLLFEAPTAAALRGAAVPLLYAGVLSCGVAYTLQIVAQKYARPTVASLIMGLESVFALLSGMLVLHEIPTTQEAVGAALMFVSIVITQLPGRAKKRA